MHRLQQQSFYLMLTFSELSDILFLQGTVSDFTDCPAKTLSIGDKPELSILAPPAGLAVSFLFFQKLTRWCWLSRVIVIYFLCRMHVRLRGDFVPLVTVHPIFFWYSLRLYRILFKSALWVWCTAFHFGRFGSVFIIFSRKSSIYCWHFRNYRIYFFCRELCPIRRTALQRHCLLAKSLSCQY